MAERQLEITMPIMKHQVNLPFDGPFVIEFAILEKHGMERTELGKMEILIPEPGNLSAVIQGKKMIFLLGERGSDDEETSHRG